MFDYQLQRGHLGPILIGRSEEFGFLRTVVLDVAERSGLFRDRGQEEVLCALAYDARKAIEGKRKILKPSELAPEEGVFYGVGVSWPVLLIQSRMLRASLAFVDHPKSYQAVAYALEDVIEVALRDDFKEKATEIINRWQMLDGGSARIPVVLEEIEQTFDELDAKKRVAELPRLLARFLAGI